MKKVIILAVLSLYTAVLSGCAVHPGTESTKYTLGEYSRNTAQITDRLEWLQRHGGNESHFYY